MKLYALFWTPYFHEDKLALLVIPEEEAAQHIRVLGEASPMPSGAIALKRFIHRDLEHTEFGQSMIKLTEELGLEGLRLNSSVASQGEYHG